eukprot:scaffold617349_cov20-Prasinocladus_malaysianus.AAC.1
MDNDLYEPGDMPSSPYQRPATCRCKCVVITADKNIIWNNGSCRVDNGSKLGRNLPLILLR